MVPRTLGCAVSVTLGFCVVGIVLAVTLLKYASSVNTHEPVFRFGTTADVLAMMGGIRAHVSSGKHVASSSASRVVIVPHHLVASEAIARGIELISYDEMQPELIVLLTPDHYGRCNTWFCTTNGKFVTYFGEVPVDRKAYSMLLMSTLVESSPELFLSEHGIHAITPFIRYYMPNAAILPIAVAQKGIPPESVRYELERLLGNLLEESNVSLVVSSDFSHYLRREEAYKKDYETLSSFCAKDSDVLLGVYNPSQSDCPLCLWLAKQVAESNGFGDPVLHWHSNSAELLGDTSVHETTSHMVLSYESERSDISLCTQ